MPKSPPSCSSPPEVHLRLAEVLYHDAIAKLRRAVSSGSRTALLTGADSASRHALAALVLPNAHIASCLSALLPAPGKPPLILSLINVAHERAIILHDAQEPTAVSALLGLLDVAPRTHAILATAPQPNDVAVQLRRVHRLDALIHLHAPSSERRANAAQLVAKLLNRKTGCSLLANRLVSAVPACGVGAFVAAAAAYYTAPPERAVNDLLNAAPKASPLPYARILGRDNDEGMKRVGGYDDVKRLLIDALGVDKARDATMKRLGVRSPRGVLLHGARGIGKSALARAIATATPSRTWLHVCCGDIYSRYLGESEARVRRLFAHARECAPCVVVLDDVDALAVDREKEDIGGTGVERRVLGALLAEMDGVNTADEDGVQVLACTARLKDIDAALLRPGRFDRIIHVQLPNFHDRVQILKVVADKMPVAESHESSSVTNHQQKMKVLQRIAQRTQGRTSADLVTICRRAAVIAMSENEHPNVVLERHFVAAVDEIFNRP